MKTYYRVSCTYKVHLDEKPIRPERIEFVTDEAIDSDGTLLQQAGKRFYDSLFGQVGDAFEFGAKEDPVLDLLYQEHWYDDAAHTREVATFSASENEIIRYLTAEKFGTDHVVDGERCSTRTATLIGEWVDEWRWADIFRTRERLYKKRTGHFFIEECQQKYINRPMWEDTKYRWLTAEEAQEWTKAHAPDIYENLFGDVPEDSKTVMISALVRKDTKEKLNRMRAETGHTISEIVDEAVSDLYDQNH